jgi:hypothetical protein
MTIGRQDDTRCGGRIDLLGIAPLGRNPDLHFNHIRVRNIAENSQVNALSRS